MDKEYFILRRIKRGLGFSYHLLNSKPLTQDDAEKKLTKMFKGKPRFKSPDTDDIRVVKWKELCNIVLDANFYASI